ncbi:MAG: CHAT domain-containing protein [Cyanobacteria bacterium SBLK]|nr:CHAT domain-containing protein [Cyanobacteria bacterium SBLK]
MSKIVLLKFGEGDCDIGFRVNLRIRETGKLEIEADGRLNPAPEIPRLYQDWRMVYVNRQIGFRKGNFAEANKTCYRRLKKTEERITNFSVKDSAKALECRLNKWLSGDNEGFRPIRETLLRHLNETDKIRFVISARSHMLWQLPWHLCDLFASYPHADVTLGSVEHPPQFLTISRQKRIKILVLLGGAKDINVEADLQLLHDRLPDEAELLEPLVATDFKTLTEALWHNEIDIFFFAGHSTSQGQQGRFFLNETDSVEIQELKYALQQAIARGLKLAIFNSCNGVQLARDLADLQMPAVVVMREPIPDEAAQNFLKYFLEAFAKNKMPLYRAVKEARERLQGLEKIYPNITWLPVLYQHPYAKDLRWDEMLRSPYATNQPSLFSHLHRLSRSTTVLVATVAIISGAIGGWIGATVASQHFTKKGNIEGMREEGAANCLLAMTLEKQLKSQEALEEWQYCLNVRNSINEEREWKRLAKKRIQELEGQNSLP